MAKRVNYRDQVQDGELDLSMSDLQEVPVRDIALAKKATSLDLSNNHLISLNKNFPTLTHLIKLDLSKNQIASLPSNFGDLILLRHLDLYSNKLSHLPLSFGRLTNLKWLDLKNNPLVPALQEVAGPCQDEKQCQNCAKKVVQVLGESQRRLDEELARQQRAEKEREMVEKAAAKKEQQKNKKAVKNEGKKKSSENGVKSQPPPQKQQQKKKDKGNKQSQRNVKKSNGSFLGRLFKRTLLLTLLVSTALGLLYYLDIERFRQVKAGAERALSAGIDLLPPQVFVALNQTSEFLNSDPRVKNHWANLKEISAVVRDRALALGSAVSSAVPIYVEDIKRVIFDSKKTDT